MKTEAILLRSTDYGESDRIIGLLTEHFGKVSSFAPSARKSLRRFGGGLDLFSYLHVQLRPSRSKGSGLWRLMDIELINLHLPLRNNLERLAIASYLAELTWSLLGEGDPQPNLFVWWRETLERLSQVNTPRLSVPQLDLELLRICGYAPRWDACIHCGVEPTGKKLFFSYDRGGITCKQCGYFGAGKWVDANLVRALAQGKPILENQVSPACEVVDAFVAHTLGRYPKSQEFREEILK